MPETYEYPKGVVVNRETIAGLAGDEALELSAEEVRTRIAARDKGAAQILASYRKQRGIGQVKKG